MPSSSVMQQIDGLLTNTKMDQLGRVDLPLIT